MIDAERIAELEAVLDEARTRIDEQKLELKQAEQRSTDLEKRIRGSEAELENPQLCAEVKMLRTWKERWGKNKVRRRGGQKI